MAEEAAPAAEARQESRFSHAWRVEASQLQAVCYWPERLVDWHLDDAAGHELAGVAADALGHAAGRGWVSGQILTFVLAPFAGVLIERMDRRKLLVWTQALAGLQSLALAWLTLTKRITIHEIIALSALQG